MNAAAVPVTPWGVLMTVVAAAGFGLCVSLFATRRLRTFVIGRQHQEADSRARSLPADLVTGGSALDLWHAVIDSSAPSLANVRVRIVEAGSHDAPVVARRVTGLDSPDPDRVTVVIPPGGAVVRFSDPRLGQELLVSPSPGFGNPQVSRVMLLALADQIESFARVGLLAGM